MKTVLFSVVYVLFYQLLGIIVLLTASITAFLLELASTRICLEVESIHWHRYQEGGDRFSPPTGFVGISFNCTIEHTKALL